MQKINSEADLKAAILHLESEQTGEGIVLKQQFNIAYDSIKPLNLIKSTIQEAAASMDLRDNIVNTSLGIAAGYVSKKLFESTSHSPLRKLFGTVLMFGITNLVTKHPEAIKTLGSGLLQIVKSKISNTIKESRANKNQKQKMLT